MGGVEEIPVIREGLSSVLKVLRKVGIRIVGAGTGGPGLGGGTGSVLKALSIWTSTLKLYLCRPSLLTDLSTVLQIKPKSAFARKNW